MYKNTHDTYTHLHSDRAAHSHVVHRDLIYVFFDVRRTRQVGFQCTDDVDGRERHVRTDEIATVEHPEGFSGK